MAVCAFCGKSVPTEDAVKLLLIATTEETQTIFAHAQHLVEHLHPSVPLHPDITEAATRRGVGSG